MSPRGITLALAAMISLAALPAVAQKKEQKAPVRKEVSKSRQAEDSGRALRRWLDEDVAYIITDEEKSAFKALKTDEEREQFIENF